MEAHGKQETQVPCCAGYWGCWPPQRRRFPLQGDCQTREEAVALGVCLCNNGFLHHGKPCPAHALAAPPAPRCHSGFCWGALW